MSITVDNLRITYPQNFLTGSNIHCQIERLQKIERIYRDLEIFLKGYKHPAELYSEENAFQMMNNIKTTDLDDFTLTVVIYKRFFHDENDALDAGMDLFKGDLMEKFKLVGLENYETTWLIRLQVKNLNGFMRRQDHDVSVEVKY